MKTPIIDFVDNYIKSGSMRLHVPGHKGEGFFGVAERDITEVKGADVLSCPKGIIAKSQEFTANIFSAGATIFSTEGSTLAIKEMVFLAAAYAKSIGRKPLFLAARNAHKAFVNAAMLVGAEVEWLYGNGSVIEQCVTAKTIEKKLIEGLLPAAVYVTTPDYLGNTLDIKAIKEVLSKYDVPLIVDNAHGAYLKYLSPDMHPITLGADMCVDSAHKTLPALTGAAYLHISNSFYNCVKDDIEQAVNLFSGSSPSYLILQSMDKLNETLNKGYRDSLKKCAEAVDNLKDKLTAIGYTIVGDERLKLTISAKPYGYCGDIIAERLRNDGIECEFSDEDYVVMMFTPSAGEGVFDKVFTALKAIEKRENIDKKPPCITPKKQVMSIREAMLSKTEEIAVNKAIGKVFVYSSLNCPPAVPILVAGEEVDENAVELFEYYKIDRIKVVKK